MSIFLGVQRRYWRNTLAGAPNKSSLKTDFELSAGANSPGKYIRVTVPTDLTQGLESLALACGATLFTVAMAAWQVAALLLFNKAYPGNELQLNICKARQLPKC